MKKIIYSFIVIAYCGSLVASQKPTQPRSMIAHQRVASILKTLRPILSPQQEQIFTDFWAKQSMRPFKNHADDSIIKIVYKRKIPPYKTQLD